jgi:hypothetical protein
MTTPRDLRLCALRFLRILGDDTRLSTVPHTKTRAEVKPPSPQRPLRCLILSPRNLRVTASPRLVPAPTFIPAPQMVTA